MAKSNVRCFLESLDLDEPTFLFLYEAYVDGGFEDLKEAAESFLSLEDLVKLEDVATAPCDAAVPSNEAPLETLSMETPHCDLLQMAYQAPCRAAELAVGCLIGGMIGDALGTCCEGWNPDKIRQLAVQKGWASGLIRDFIPCLHMGQGFYVGPPRRERDEGDARCGMYSDDTNAVLALATSLVELRELDGPKVALKYAEFFLDETCPRRFCPDTAMEVVTHVANGEDYRKTGRQPFFKFADGSFANGGAMRSSPLGIAFAAAPAEELRRAAEEAVRSSHVHPEAVDAAALQAHAVAFAKIQALSGSSDDLGAALLQHLEGLAQTRAMCRRLGSLRAHLATISQKTDDVSLLQSVLNDSDPRPDSGFDFQIASVDMMPCVFWITARYWSVPEEAIMRAIAIGGDTDTTAMMVGSILGAHHGTTWIPQRWWDGLENGTRGRDYAVKLGERLSQLSLRQTLTWGGAPSCSDDTASEPSAKVAKAAQA